MEITHQLELKKAIELLDEAQEIIESVRVELDIDYELFESVIKDYEHTSDAVEKMAVIDTLVGINQTLRFEIIDKLMEEIN